ncbi:MAG: hypothetical protein Kow00121_60710 [Elainellaceae cyanobacterium]
MYEVITTLIILGVVFALLRTVFGTFIPRSFITWVGFGVFLLILATVFISPDNRLAGTFWGILSFPFRPLGLSLLLLGYALRFGVGKISLGRSQILSAFIILVIFSLPLTAYLLTAQTEQRTALEFSTQQEADNVEAIVVLGDGTIPTDPVYRTRTQLSNPTNGLGVALESRLAYAAQLYIEQGDQPPIIVSVGPQALLAEPGRTPAQAINAYLGKFGIPAEKVVIDNEGFDPRSSAVAVRELFLGEGAVDECAVFAICEDGEVRRLNQNEDGPVIPIILVTPAITLRRAISTFNNLNFRVVPRPTDFYVFQIQGGLDLAIITDLIPNAEALAINTRVIDEYLAWIYYFMRGWLSDPLSV